MKGRVTGGANPNETSFFPAPCAGELHTDDTMESGLLARRCGRGNSLKTMEPRRCSGDLPWAINKFVGKQRYSGTNNFNALQSVLERVMQNFAALDGADFCDGEN